MNSQKTNNSNQTRINMLKNILIEMKTNSPGLKPNFNALSRETGVSRQTISRLWKNPDVPAAKRRKRKSKFDPYRQEISDEFEKDSATIRAVFSEFQEKYPEVFTSYSSFKNYVRTNQLKRL